MAKTISPLCICTPAAPIPSPVGVSAGLASIIVRALAKTERSRFDNAEEMRAALVGLDVHDEDLETLVDEPLEGDQLQTAEHIVEPDTEAHPRVRVSFTNEQTLSKHRVDLIRAVSPPARTKQRARRSFAAVFAALLAAAIALFAIGRSCAMPPAVSEGGTDRTGD